jgi:hypothetical protein
MSDPHERARALGAAARFCAQRTGNTSRAVALYEAAIEDDPEVDGAFTAIEQILRNRGDVRELAKAYARQLERLEAKNADKQERADLLEKLATVQADELDDRVGAVRSFDRLVGLRPEDALVRAKIADLLEHLGEHAVAIRTLEVAVQHRPFDARLYRKLAHLAAATGDSERVFASSAVLVALGEAEPAERLAYSNGAPQAPGQFERTFDDNVWRELSPSNHPVLVDRLMVALDRAAVQSWVDAAEARGLSTLPPEQQRIDPKTSTISAVKSFQWASRLLGVAEPSLYAQPQNAAVGVATVRARTPVILLGRPVLTGRSTIELAFLATRHLTYLRPGYRLLSFYPKDEEITTLIRAALAVSRADGAPPSLDATGQQLVARLRKNLASAEIAELRQIVSEIHERGSPIDLLGWARAAETIACRAALLASGDTTVALTLLGVAGGPSAGLSARERSADLSAFSVSERYLSLRRLLGLQLAQ